MIGLGPTYYTSAGTQSGACSILNVCAQTMSQEPYRGDLKLTCMTGGGIVARIARGDQPERCREARKNLSLSMMGPGIEITVSSPATN